MAFQSAPRCASVAIHGTSNGKQITNLLHARFPDAYSSTNIEDLATSVFGVVAGSYPPLMSENLLLTDVTVTGLTSITDLQFVASDTPAPGTMSGLPLPANNSLVTTLRSDFTGRSARGRIYAFAAGASALQTTGGDLYTSAYAANLLAMWLEVKDAIVAAGWQHIILSRFSEKVERPSGVGFLVTTITIRNETADSQRKRLPKGH